jgi:hypothetical protein
MNYLHLRPLLIHPDPIGLKNWDGPWSLDY